MTRALGRPRALTDELQNAIVAAIRAGATQTQASLANGISPGTTGAWINRGRAEIERREAGLTPTQRREQGHPPATREEQFVGFTRAVAAARARGEVTVLAKLHRQMDGGAVVKEVTRTLPDGTVEHEVTRTQPDTRAITFYLERVHPDRYGRSSRLTLAGDPSAPLLAGAPVDEDALAARVAARLRPDNDDEVIDAEVVDGPRELPPAG